MQTHSDIFENAFKVRLGFCKNMNHGTIGVQYTNSHMHLRVVMATGAVCTTDYRLVFTK